MRSRTKKSIAGAVAAGVLLMGVFSACATESDEGDAVVPETTEQVDSQPAPAAEPDPEPRAEPEPEETAGQENARRSAESYLESQAFSRSGLIDQLEFEGYSTADATYGVDANDVDWNEQAAKSAQAYLGNQAFSRSGLIEQLEFEGFTPAQAAYGVNQTGL